MTVAKRRLHLFAAFHDIGLDDLVSEATRAALVAARRYQRGRRCSLSSWLYRAASSAIIDLWRSRRSSHAREQQLAAMTRFADLVCQPKLESDDLITSAANIRSIIAERLARYAASGRRGRPQRYPPVQRLAIVALLAHCDCSARRMASLLRSSPLLREALGLTCAPSRRTIDRMWLSGSKFLK